MKGWLTRLVCARLGHPPRTWGDREMEDPILEAINNRPNGQRVEVAVSCVCGRKIVPFRAKPLRGDRE